MYMCKYILQVNHQLRKPLPSVNTHEHIVKVIFALIFVVLYVCEVSEIVHIFCLQQFSSLYLFSIYLYNILIYV